MNYETATLNRNLLLILDIVSKRKFILFNNNLWNVIYFHYICNYSIMMYMIVKKYAYVSSGE